MISQGTPSVILLLLTRLRTWDQTKMLWFSSLLLASLSLVLSGLAVWVSFRVQKLLRDASTRSLMQLSSEVAELTSASESLSAQQRRLAARVGMREVRHKREQALDAEPPLSENVGEQVLPRAKLKEIARARGLVR